MADGSNAKAADPIDLVVFLWARRRLLIGLTLLAAVAGVVAAFVITPQFRSEVVLFPAITNSVSKALLNEQAGGRDDILGLGDEQDAEQLLQILNSDRVRDRTAAKFDLAEAYHIDPNGAHKNSELREAFEDHIKFEYTKFGSVRVSVQDEKAQRAADVANYIAAQVDSVWRDMARERAEKGVQVVRQKVDELTEEIAQLNDSMRVLRGLGVQDYHSQTERYNEYLGAAIVKGDQRAIKAFEDRFKVLAQYGGAYVTLQDRLYNETKRLSTLRMKLEQAEADMDSDMPHKFVVNAAYVADKKSYPVRWLVVAVSTVSGFLLALMLIIARENIRKIQASHG